MFKYTAGADEDDQGELEVVELTKRQRGLVSGAWKLIKALWGTCQF